MADVPQTRRSSEISPLDREGPLRNLLESHLKTLAVRQYSLQTIKTRREQLGVFLRWCANNAVEKLQDISRIALQKYQYDLLQYRKKNGQALSLRTQHGLLVPLRVWFRWMIRESHIQQNPALDLELPRLGRYLPKHVC